MSLAQLVGARPGGHRTLFVTDFAMGSGWVRDLRADFDETGSELVLLDGVDVAAALPAALAGEPGCPATVILLASRHDSFVVARAATRASPHITFCRVELPAAGSGFTADRARWLWDLTTRGDLDAQDRAADEFFDLLAMDDPYRVRITGPGTELEITDSEAWFQLAGRPTPGEVRILPGGEVAYTGSRVTGEITISGALLAIPQQPSAQPMATLLMSYSNALDAHPVTLVIDGGRITELLGDSPLGGELEQLIDDDPRYAEVTEVGVSFNATCRNFVHDWPAASNEGHPGAHVGIGGDPSPGAASGEPMVHLDLIMAKAAVEVNGHQFGSVDRGV